jgi:2-keto-4-pentenoate hydratase
MLSSDEVEQAAAILMAARRAVRALDDLPDGVRPKTVADGYRIQDALRRGWGGRVSAWKIGATAKPVQNKFGVTEPFGGPVFEADTVASPAKVKAAAFVHRAIESEFAFRFGAGLPARSKRYAREEILAAVDAVVPVIELVGPRFKDLLFGRAPTAIADAAVNAGLVVGTAVTEWKVRNLAGHAVRLFVDGKTVAEGSGANVLGDPLVVLDWAVEHLRSRGIGLETGQLISTGTTTGVEFLEPGQHAVADFGALGRVEVTYV